MLDCLLSARSSFTARLLVALAAAVAVAAPYRTATAAPPPVEHFTRWPAISEVVPSPSGRRLAVIVPGPSGWLQLGVMSLDPVGDIKLIGSFAQADVSDVRWINEDRLAFSGTPRALEIREGDAGTFAVNADGTGLRALIRWSTNPGFRVLPYGWRLHSTLDDGSADVVVAREDLDAGGNLRFVELARMNTTTGELRNLSRGAPDGTALWLLDARGEPRVATSLRNGRLGVHWRKDAAAEGGWTEVANFPLFDPAAFTPVRFEAPDQLLVLARINRDSDALYRYNLSTARMDPEPVVAVNDFDIPAELVNDSGSGKTLGVRLVADRPLTVWFEASMQQLQAGIDAALPAGRFNAIQCGRRCASTRFFVITSRSDRQPGEYYLFDRDKRSLARIGAARPWIDETTQARRTFHRINTPDGLRMPVTVTHPPGAADTDKRPAVLVVHGGPWVRGTDLRWNDEAQFLASRGYRVLEPEFRGSTGFGDRWFRAGFKQWGLAMQEDLATTVRWAAERGLIDPSRVCIYGGSYGGYAALMAPITHPGMFRCAASFAGVTDIDLMYSIHWSDSNDTVRRFSMPTLIGDRDKDAAQLARTSPLKRVGEIKVPVLLSHGRLDRRVPIDHASRFEAAAAAAGVKMDTLYFNDEGHGLFNPDNHARFLTRLEQFFATSLR